jgi:hypothetical protein
MAIVNNGINVLQKLIIEILYDSTISLWGIFPNKIKSVCQRDIHPFMLIAAIFTITKT